MIQISTSYTRVPQSKEMRYFNSLHQSPDLSPIEHALHLLKTRMTAERQAAAEGSCSKGLEKHLKKETQHLVRLMTIGHLVPAWFMLCLCQTL